MAETRILAEFITKTAYEDIPMDAIDRAKVAIRDYLGVGLYGSKHPIGDRIHGYVEATAPGDAATLLGGGSASLPGAALANGTDGHAIDYDDTFESIVVHPTSPVFSAALAAAEGANASGKRVLEGYVLGVETAYRIGHSTYPTHYENGWHGTGTVGVFGAAAAGASIRGLSQSQTEHAFGISASSSSALKKNFGSMTKPLHAGHAAAMGLRSVLLSERGFTADSAVLEGAIGYGAAMTSDGAYDPSAITDGLEKRWAVDDIGFKPYPSGVITHAAMDAFRDLVQEHELGPDGIESVTVTLDEAASEMLIHENPSNALQAKFSIEFCLAAVLRAGDPDIRAFSDDYVTDSMTREAMALVERDFEPNLFDGSFANYGARITVETVTGETHVAEERYAPGTPTNPVSEERLREKFFACATPVVGQASAETVANAIERLETEGALNKLLAGITA